MKLILKCRKNCQMGIETSNKIVMETINLIRFRYKIMSYLFWCSNMPFLKKNVSEIGIVKLF